MNQINRTSDNPQPRSEHANAPRGDELRQAASAFAELLAKERRGTSSQKSDRDRAGDSDGGAKKDGAGGDEVRSAAGGFYGLPLVAGRDGGSQHGSGNRQQQDDLLDLDVADKLGPPIDAFGIFRNDSSQKETGSDSMPSCEEPRYLGGPIRFLDESSAKGSNKENDSDRDPFPSLESESQSTSGEHSLPTPGDLLLQAFSRPQIEAAKPVEKSEAPKSVDHIDAIQELGFQIAERILVSKTELAGASEMLIQLKDSVLPGTEVRMVQAGDRMQVMLVTDNASSFHLLASRQADLQAKLGDNVVVQLSFDPDRMISQQRLERPLATEAGQQTGDDRRRDRERDPEQRDQHRQRRQDHDQ